MDVSIRGTVDGAPFLAVIECKDFNAATTGPVGRQWVDALDSKRLDLGADAALICSNAGFTRDALNKARRKGIGMISVLRAGDRRAKAVIESEVVLCRIRCGPWQFQYEGADERVSRLEPVAHQLRYKGLSLDDWLQHRASLIAAMNPEVTDHIRADFRFVEPIAFDAPGGSVPLVRATVIFNYTTEWLSCTVQHNASLGMYDYLRRRVRIAPGTNTYTVSGINFETAVPTTRPAPNEELPPGFAHGEVAFALTMIEGLATASQNQYAKLEPLVVPEDLDLALKTSELGNEAV